MELIHKLANRIELFIIQFFNFTFFEITLKQRILLTYNHLNNSLIPQIQKNKTHKINLVGIFIISLPNRNDRRKKIKEQVEKLNLNYQFVKGIFFTTGILEAKYFSKLSLKYLSHGALGCASAHIKLWQLIALKNENEYFIIFEDDIILCDNFKEKLSYIINNYPLDCDLFYLGSRNERKRDIYQYYEKGINRVINPRLGAYAYILYPKAARKLLNKIVPIKLICGGIDTAIGILARKKLITCYQLDSSIVKHDDNIASSIFNPLNKRKKIDNMVIKTWPMEN